MLSAPPRRPPAARSSPAVDRGPAWLGLAVAAVLLAAGWALDARRGGDHPDAKNEPAGDIPGGLPFVLEESSRRAGLATVHEGIAPHASLSKWRRRIFSNSAAVAVADVDGDGFQDVYVTNAAIGSRNKLFLNRRDGTFREAAAAWAVASVNGRAGSLRPLFADFNGDGGADLFLTTTHGPPRVFLRRGARFVEDLGSRFEAGEAYAANAADLDADGDLDLLVGYSRPFDLNPLEPERYDFFNRSHQSARLRPGRLRAYRNDGRGRFSPWPELAMPLEIGFPHAVGVYAMEGDGRPWIHWALVWPQRDKLFRVAAPGVLEDRSASLPRRHVLHSMSSEIADLDGDGRPLIYVTDIYDPGWAIGGNMLLKKLDDGRWIDVARQRGVKKCGWGWGAKFVDLDMDGRLDLVVANGMLTGGKDYRYKRSVIQQASPERQVDVRNWPVFGESALSGGQRDCVFYNVGARFMEAAERAGLNDRSDGRGLATIDPLNDGGSAFVVVNQNQALRYYVSRPKGVARRWVGFDLRGPEGAPAFGARLTLRTSEGRVVSAQVQPANGYMAQSDPRLKFGLGGEAVPVSAEIRWPSGRMTTLPRPAVGRYHKAAGR